jgi:hypothetical protein
MFITNTNKFNYAITYRVSINDCGIQVGFDCVPTLSPEIE